MMTLWHQRRSNHFNPTNQLVRRRLYHVPHTHKIFLRSVYSFILNALLRTYTVTEYLSYDFYVQCRRNVTSYGKFYVYPFAMCCRENQHNNGFWFPTQGMSSSATWSGRHENAWHAELLDTQTFPCTEFTWFNIDFSPQELDVIVHPSTERRRVILQDDWAGLNVRIGEFVQHPFV